MITTQEFEACKRLIESGYIAEIFLNKEGKPQPWGGIYHLAVWDKRKISREMFAALVEAYGGEHRGTYLRVKKREKSG